MDPSMTLDGEGSANAAVVPSFEQPQTQGSTQDVSPHPSTSSKKACRFFNTKNGCRAGASCPFLHHVSQTAPTSADDGTDVSSTRKQSPKVTKDVNNGDSERRVRSRHKKKPPEVGRNYQAAPVETTRVVQPPITQAQVTDPREFQLNQIRKRFPPVSESPRKYRGQDISALEFRMVPSDPDFPFDIAGLECTLRVPLAYPASDALPTLGVRNSEMDRGYQINVERGFDVLVQTSKGASLLRLMNALDKRLESLLVAEKAETIKIIANAGQKNPQKTAADQPLNPEPVQAREVAEPPKHAIVKPTYTPEEREAASRKRETETRQLENRLGRVPQFAKGSDGVSYTVPVDPRKRSDLPSSLQAIRTAKLLVPWEYNLKPCAVELIGIDRKDADAVERNFEDRVVKNPHLSLFSHVNYLSQSLHLLTVEEIPPAQELETTTIATDSQEVETTPKLTEEIVDADRPHLITIPRPPEWNVDGSESEDSDSSFTGSEYDAEGEAQISEDEKANTTSAPTTVERGIMLSFPNLELYGIELLELTSLGVTVKCERCKDTLDVSKLKNNSTGGPDSTRHESCKKCANPMGIGYRMDLMHSNSFRAGYLDLDGCTVVDMLLSTFIPTCSDCSTPHASTGVVSVRGESTLAICRTCHRKMTFKIPEVKFLMVSTATVRATRALPRKKPKEKLGIVAGTELPKRGRCKHYGKSYRWFRFSCCGKVFTCDKCHDEASDHPNEHANRMICGFCSREQNYRPEDCGICHAGLTGKRGTGFWEGGKGTRDRVRMSRKDPRKFKRRPGTQPANQK